MIRSMMPPPRWFPELYLLDSFSAKRSLWNEAHKPVAKDPLFWITVFGFMAGSLACVSFIASPVARWTQTSRQWVEFWGVGSAVLGTTYLSLWIVREKIRRNLRKGLIARGYWLCLSCGYDLTGNVSGCCTECGNVVRHLPARANERPV